MSIPVKTAPPVMPQAGLDRIKRMPAGTVEQQKARLREATREFESFFTYQMLKTMRKTIPESPLTSGQPMSGSMGKETFTDMFDMEIARRVTLDDNRSIGAILYRSLEKLIDNKAAENPVDTRIHREVGPASIPIQNEVEPIERRQPSPLEVPPEEQTPLPVSRRPTSVTEDPILRQYGRYIHPVANEHGVDSALVASVIKVESDGDAKATSAAGAKGLMQLMDGTAADMGVKDSFDPRENIQGGVKYLRRMLDRYGDLKLALAAYNAGPGNVDRYGGVPPFPETEAYVERVTSLMSSHTKNLARVEPKASDVAGR